MNVNTTALLTDMNQPLGRMVGNAVEVDESLATLESSGPADLEQLVLALGAELLVAVGRNDDLSSATATLQSHLDSGAARQKFDEMVVAQGGDPATPRAVAPVSDWNASRAGCVTAIDANKLGWVIIELGGGRKVMTDSIRHDVGVEMLVRLGDTVSAGQPLMRVFADPSDVPRVQSLLDAVVQITDASRDSAQLIVERIDAQRLDGD